MSRIDCCALLRLLLLERLRGFLQSLGRLLCRCAPACPLAARLTHRVRRLLQPARGVLQRLRLLALPLGLTTKLLELPRRLFEFVGERALRVAAGAAALLTALCPGALLLGLQLPPRQLSQTLGNLVDLLAALLLRRLLLHLVLIGLRSSSSWKRSASSEAF